MLVGINDSFVQNRILVDLILVNSLLRHVVTEMLLFPLLFLLHEFIILHGLIFSMTGIRWKKYKQILQSGLPG